MKIFDYNYCMFRTGIGYDVHRFKKGRDLILGGVKIDFEYGLDGHSDADVLCHAVADSLLGAIGQRDIGYWFPPDDDSIKDISSLLILEKVKSIIFDKNYKISNVDAMIISEKPKIAPYVDKMIEKISNSLEIAHDQIGIKATSNELMGFIGRGEGMASLATSTVYRD